MGGPLSPCGPVAVQTPPPPPWRMSPRKHGSADVTVLIPALLWLLNATPVLSLRQPDRWRWSPSPMSLEQHGRWGRRPLTAANPRGTPESSNAVDRKPCPRLNRHQHGSSCALRQSELEGVSGPGKAEEEELLSGAHRWKSPECVGASPRFPRPVHAARRRGAVYVSSGALPVLSFASCRFWIVCRHREGSDRPSLHLCPLFAGTLV